MIKSASVLVLISLLISAFTLKGNDSKVPEGWVKAGSNPNGYEMGVDNSVYQNGKTSAYIKSIEKNENKFGTLMQTIKAENYLGKRIQLSGYVKSKKADWSSMWMRIDGNKKQLEFDNMKDRPIKGTTDWTQYKIVLDVPSESEFINYGVLLSGQGEVWFDNLQLKVVDKSVPVTNQNKENNVPTEPVNLNFEK